MQHQTHIQDDNCSIGEGSCIDLWADVDERNRGIFAGSIDNSPNSKDEASQPPVRDVQIERRDNSKSEVPCYIIGTPSLSNSLSNIDSSKNAIVRKSGNPPNTYVLAPVIAPPMERMQRRLSASSHARTSQGNATSDVSLISNRSDHSTRSGLHSANARVFQGHPRSDVSLISTESEHSARSGLRSSNSCETKAPRDAQFVRRVEPLRRNSMTNAQIRTYERIERYKALEAQSTASPIPRDSQSFPTDSTHLRQLPFGYDSNSMDNRGDMRRQNGISNADRPWRAGTALSTQDDLPLNVRSSPDRVWRREDDLPVNVRGSADKASRRDLSTKDDLLVNFRSKSPPAERILKNLFRPLSLGVASMMNGSNHDGLRDMALTRQSQSSRSLDEPATEKKGCPRSVPIPSTRNSSIPQHSQSGSNRSY